MASMYGRNEGFTLPTVAQCDLRHRFWSDSCSSNFVMILYISDRPDCSSEKNVGHIE